MNPLLRGAGVLLALVLVALNGVALLGESYTRFAERSLDRPEAAPTVAASRIATRLPPWSAEHHALHGWILAEGQNFAALEVYGRALRLAPADALLWTEYALALARLRQFDQLGLPTARAFALAPASPAVQASLAAMGVSYWEIAPADLQDQWLRSIRYELAHNGTAFIRLITARGQTLSFCLGPAARIMTRRWCEKLDKLPAQPAAGE